MTPNRTDFKKRFENAPDKSSSIAEARKARAEKDRLDRERVKAEQEAQRAKELLEEPKNQDEVPKSVVVQEAVVQEEEEAAEVAAVAEGDQPSLAPTMSLDDLEGWTRTEVQPVEAHAVADALSSEYAEQEGVDDFSGGFTATGMYEYEATGDDELAFNEGDQITNIEVIDEGWWRGECNGRYGLFPANYVQAN